MMKNIKYSYIFTIAAIFIMFVPDLFISFGTDYSVYVNNGFEIINGKVPYLDFFHHKLPLYDYFLAFMISVFGNHWLSLKLILILTYLLSGLSFFIFARVLFESEKWSLYSTLLYLFYITRLDIDSARNGSIIVFGLTFIFLSLSCIYFVIHNNDYRKARIYSLLAGVFNAAAILTRQSFVEPGIVITALLVLYAVKRKDVLISFKLSYFLFYLIGLLLPLALVLFHFSSIAGWERFSYNVLLYNVEYSKHFSFWMSLIKHTWIVFGKTLIFWIILASYFSLKIQQAKSGSQSSKKANYSLSEINFSLICLAASVFILVISKGRQLYYFLEIIPFLIVSSLLMLKFYLREINLKYSFSEHSLLKYPLMVVAIAISLFAIDFTSFVNKNFTAFNYFQKTGYTYKNYPDMQVAEDIKNQVSHSQRDNTLFVAGSRANIYVLSGSDAPYYSFIPSVSNQISLKPAYITNEIKKYSPTFILEWDYMDYYPDSTNVKNYILNNYDYVNRYTRRNNFPYKSNKYAVLYVKKVSTQRR